VADRRDNPPKSITQVAIELWELAVAYAKQETIDPLRGLGRFLGYGISGVLLLAVGSVMIGLSALRLLQTQTDTTFTGNLSWVPYLIVMAGGLAVCAAVIWRIVKREGPGL
jgi:hypothetical protein